MARDLEQRVADQFQKDSELRVLFFFDPEEDYRDEIEEWTHDQIHCVEASEALFQIKYRLEQELSSEQVFLYFPHSKPAKWDDNPLADLWVSNQELRIDEVAELREGLGLSAKHQALVQRYAQELGDPKRREFLGSVLRDEALSEENLKWGLAAYHAADVFEGVSFRSIPREELVLASVLVGATDGEAFDEFLERCKDLELLDLLGRQFGQRFELGSTELTQEAVRKAAQTMKYNLLLRFIDDPTEEDPYQSLWLKEPLARNRITSLANAWRDTRALEKDLEETLGILAPEVQETRLAEVYGPDTTFGYLTPALRQRRLEKATEALEGRPSQARRMADDLRTEDDPVAPAAECVWQMGTFYRIVGDHPTLDFGTPEAFIERYSEELYRCDTTYRKAVSAYRQIQRESPKLRTLIEEAFGQFLTHYHEQFVHPLNTAWQKALESHIQEEGEFETRAAQRQGAFHTQYIAPTDQKTAVVISDALRYEVAEELVGELSKDARKEVDLSPTMGALPSVTSVGMAHLLPHTSISLDGSGTPEIDGRSTSGTRNRERILQEENPDARAVRYADIRGKSMEEGRELFKEHPLVYIYHDRIDATGDDRDTETQVIPEIDKAVSELAQLVQTLNNWNVYRVLVTTDHGFLYSDSELPESMIESFPDVEGEVLRKNRTIVAERFFEEPGYTFPLRALSDIDHDADVGVPKAVNRYRLRGAGKQYAHGGASLQEMVVPTLSVRKAREEVAEKVGVRLLSGDRTIKTGALTAKLLQTESVSSGRQPRTVHAALYDDEDNVVSEEKTLTLDAQSEDPTDRQEKLVLTLGSEANELNFCELRVFDVEDRLNPLIEQKYSIQQLIERDF